MKKLFISLLTLYAVSAYSQKQIVVGDMNNDGELTVTDVTVLADAIVGNSAIRRLTVSEDPYNTDNTNIIGQWSGVSGSITFNEDGTTDYKEGYTYEYLTSQCLVMFYNSSHTAVECLQVMKLTREELVLGNASLTQFYTYSDHLKLGANADGTMYYEDANGHRFVDLGLSSGTLWATCNIGSDTPSEVGDFFAWGETSPKEEYTWETYFDSNDGMTFAKYYNGTVNGKEGKTVLESADDAAQFNWGKKWCIPTDHQWNELLMNCKCAWDSPSNGWKITGPNNNYIVLPNPGRFVGSEVKGKNKIGDYWSTELSGSNKSAYTFEVEKGEGCARASDDRYVGNQIRPVRNK